MKLPIGQVNEASGTVVEQRRETRGRPPGPTLTREELVALLKQTKGSRTKAAKMSGVGRTTFYKQLVAAGIVRKSRFEKL